MKTLQEIKSGVVIGFTILAILALFGIAYAAINYAEIGGQNSGDSLSADKWNKMYEHSVPPGAIIAFDLNECPTGWTEYTPAYGRFLRGIDKSGTNIDPDGARVKGSTQVDAYQSHTHSLKTRIGTSAHTAGIYPSSANDGTLTDQGANAVIANGGTETRPKNVAVLYCRKS